ncbi:uncharacterized protein Z518_07680 [Rhinocladiella mackenziei CBS 650.93]|uniref:Rhinocladiella mackenziei CBS 650.93 unplaced genomic scaffold supercont1.5, whole genome shotgun sequence n=1 Tax=Rhinocladiella mackenziei CBS 650.93 TaxID=1442369 RepID=A0A0D2FPK4_9EURO|nr:uncharacterized protein Z518_07680 [Rhinocladiella mackenziei CBS 650.93]KIX04127.1 hypothetical protein Z518_07680 [Rhinocladiella mackenziei CBS 650.93]
MAPCPSIPVRSDDLAEPNHESASPVSASTTDHQHGNTYPGPTPCRSGNHCHGCGCGCSACSCRRIKPVQDDSNREVYSGQGGQFYLPGLSPRHPSSLSTDGSGHMNHASFNNSFEVHDHLNDRLTDQSLARLDAINRQNSRAPLGGSVVDPKDEDECPWHYFVSPLDSGPDHMSPPEDSSGMIGPGNMDGSSMILETGGVSRDDISMLSSYEAAFPRQSLPASQLLNEAGAAFANHNHKCSQFLRLN